MDEEACIQEYSCNEQLFTSIDLDSPTSNYEVPFLGSNIVEKETENCKCIQAV